MVFVFLFQTEIYSIYELDIKLHAFVTFSEICCQHGVLRLQFTTLFVLVNTVVIMNLFQKLNSMNAKQ
ncbi:hypothetical protein DU508_18740 [Pedobacter chinensis]|uniref:Uncharacterized protein n=1 Tax=Pedobacter chinensis TaxID=2282421 RepID=A0A369PVZ5_9SPHI|nr:hypothetical protein DU508_18740 [Pedobacter chinensis]